LIPPEHPWQRDAAEVVAELDTDLGAGLTAPEAARRLREHGRNELETEKPLRRGGGSSGSSRTR
jgi:hypothetical protein